MAAKQPQRRLPFDAVNGKSRSGRPRAPRVTLVCSKCGSDFERYASAVAKRPGKRAFCTPCYFAARKEGLNPRTAKTNIVELQRLHNGERVKVDAHGYIYIYEPTFALDRQWSGLPRGWHFEHRVVAARTLRRPFRPGEHVHHINGVKTDNRSENLRVVSQREHRQLHNEEIAEKLRRLAEYERRFGPLMNTADARALEDAESALRRIGSFKES